MNASVINIVALTGLDAAAVSCVPYGALSAAVQFGTLQAQEPRSTMKQSAG